MSKQVKNAHVIPAHLPKRLTISFPIWGLYDTDGNGAYADVDRMMREHRERGFNCLRLDSGAGVMHAEDGRLLPSAKWDFGFGEYDRRMRQFAATEPGYCDTRSRLIDILRAAKRHDVYVILSSWYYLHTYWYDGDVRRAHRLLTLPPHDIYMTFACFLHYILLEVEKEGLIDRIAFAEIFNEVDGLPFCGDYNNEKGLSVGERHSFRKDHEEALRFLRERHPDVLFAADFSQPDVEDDLAPANADVYNFHSYFMWSAYTDFENESGWLKEDPCSIEDVEKQVKHPEHMPFGWLKRVHFYANLDENKVPAAEERLQRQFVQDLEKHRAKLKKGLDTAAAFADQVYPRAPIVQGEGVSYLGTYLLQWEEKCEEYWQLLEEAALMYRDMGLWGSVVRTCCGPEDPVWYSHADRLKKVNELFLHGGSDER